jgi:hypothetical protein
LIKTDLILKAVEDWQANELHPLTCGHDSDHKILKPIKQDGKVILICPDCTYTQDWVPRMVVQALIDKEREEEKI